MGGGWLHRTWLFCFVCIQTDAVRMTWSVKPQISDTYLGYKTHKCTAPDMKVRYMTGCINGVQLQAARSISICIQRRVTAVSGITTCWWNMNSFISVQMSPRVFLPRHRHIDRQIVGQRHRRKHATNKTGEAWQSYWFLVNIWEEREA